MRWSLRSTLLVIVLPLTLATLSLSASRISDLIVHQDDIAELRASAFRSIYAERYARYLQMLLKESYDHLAGRRDRLENVAAARTGMVATLERLRPLAYRGAEDDPTASELTTTTLNEWAKVQEQVDIYLERAVALAQNGEAARARSLVADDLEVLLDSRIFSSIDRKIQREQELLEERRVRVARAADHWLAPYVGAVDVREQLLPDVYETILAERFARNAYAELKSFTHYVVEGRSLEASDGEAASHAIAQLRRLQAGRSDDGHAAAESEARALGEIYARVRDAYAHAKALPPASRHSHGPALLQRIDEVFDASLLPQTSAIIRAHEQSIAEEMARLDLFITGIMYVTVGIAMMALLLSLGSPWLANRILLRPVRDLLETVSSFRGGDRDARPKLSPRNELGVLGRSLKALLDELQESAQKVRDLAFYDSTTGLPNRQFFQERLAGALTTARLQGRSMGLLSLNLTGLKQLNETLGHSAGDDLIRQIAARLRDCVRMSDIVARPNEEDYASEVSRLEGDEFTILLTKITQASDAAIAAQRVLVKITEPFVVKGREIVVNTSVGIGIYPQDGGDVETLLRNSAAAMNHALKRGGNDYQFYSEAMNVANSRKLHVQSRLAGAIARDDLSLHYQPLRDAKNGHLSGAEALLRWTDAEMGPIGPEEFIPIAEHAGLIAQVGAWALNEACTQARAWQEAGYPEFRMSVNVSASQLRDNGWVASVAQSLEDTGLSPGCLELEITETTIIQDDTKTTAALEELSGMGVGIVLDDFGTGYSSLSHLRSLPISRVKIDRSFVSEITENPDGAALTSAVVALAHSLRLKVVAEGVETHEQADFLRSNGCDELQGYLISRAVPAAEFERFLTPEKSE